MGAYINICNARFHSVRNGEFASKNHIIHSELATGKGFADLAPIPSKNVDLPFIIELKYNMAINTAIKQLHRSPHHNKAAQYLNQPLSNNNSQLLLAGFTYQRNTELHENLIERME